MALFTNVELSKWLHYDGDIAVDEATLVEKVVTGWLCNAAGLDQLPDPLPAAFFGWGLELGGIAYENPTSMSEDSAGDVSSAWGDRRRQILADVAAWGLRNGTSGDAAPLPRGNFPPATPWPDQYRGRW
jgi:hypothetical protein